jgi:hypothetical protein
MRLLIYLLALLTGFSAAEAARPVSAAPSSVGTEAGQACAQIALISADQGHVQAESTYIGSNSSELEITQPVPDTGVAKTTPVQRRDVILT